MSRSRAVGSGYVIGDVVTDVLGRGGTGTVYRATAKDGQRYAVKILDESRLADPEIVTRFVRERDVLVHLRHPNLVPVVDLVVEGTLLAVVMELVDGPDLRTLLDEGPVPAAVAAGHLSGVVRALQVAHDSGVVHRDLKPENLLFDPVEKSLRITDFGIARLAQGSTLTRLTSVMGTPDYMAPELAEKVHATPASDLYAIGVLLYEMVAGRRPFVAPHPVAVLRKHMDELPIRPDEMPHALWVVVEHLLAKRPEDRPTSAAVVAKRLEALAAQLAPDTERMPSVVARDSTNAQAPDLGRPFPSRDQTHAAGISAPPARPALELEQVEATIASPVTVGAQSALPTPTPGPRSETVFGMVPARMPEAPPEEPVPPSRRKLAPLVAVLVTIAVIAGLTVALSRGGPPSSAAITTFPVSHVFAPEPMAEGVVLARTWTLDGAGLRELTARIDVTNAAKVPRKGSFDEVVPKSVAAEPAGITTVSTAQVSGDHSVLSYAFDLAPSRSTTFTYAVTLPGTRSVNTARQQLAAWAEDQLAAASAHRLLVAERDAGKLVRLALLPTALTLPVGGRNYVALSGWLANGERAPASVLVATTYESSNRGVARVESGLVTGVSPGVARVVVRLGKVAAVVNVTVVPATSKTPPPVKAAPVAPGFTDTRTVPSRRRTSPSPTPRYRTSPSPTPRQSPTARAVATPKPTPRPSTNHAGVPIGKTYTVSVGSDGFETSGAWTRYTSAGHRSARTRTSPSGCKGSANVDHATAYWQVVLPAGTQGVWEVQVFIPGDSYRASHAQYRVGVAGGGFAYKTVAQTSYASRWVTVARTRMQSSSTIRLTNYEGWSGDCSKVEPINASTARWIYRG